MTKLEECLCVLKKQIPLERNKCKEGSYLYRCTVKMLEILEQVPWRKVIRVCKVKRNRYQEDGTARGREEDSMTKYPYLLDHHLLNLKDEIHLKGVEL